MTHRQFLAILASLLLLSVPAAGQLPGANAAAEEQLVGYWSMQEDFPAPLAGMLTVERGDIDWRASIAGVEALSCACKARLKFEFKDKRSSFRGGLSEDGETIEGFWLRPSGETKDRRDPGGSGQPFATRVRLQKIADDRWQGEIRPLGDRFTLYLKIFRNEQGMLLGAFRNPEFNAAGEASRFRVTREGDTVKFAVPTDGGGFDVRMQARLRSAPDRIEIFWSELGHEVSLLRRQPAEIPDLFPRPPGDPPYRYRQPAVTEDHWTTAPAREVGLDEAALEQLVRRIAASDPAERRPSLIHSLLVARKGKLVLEEYFFGHDRETAHDTRSAGKTLASVMLGAAMKDGIPIAPETGIYELLALRGPFANPDPRKARITLAQLLTHTAGLACNDNDEASPGNENTMQAQDREPDWWKHTLDLPMAHEPGARYAYCSANINLVGAALTAATATWLPEYFDRAVAGPLDFGTYHWNLMPTEEGYLGGGAFLRPRDLLKVGQAYLDGGVWRDRRIVEPSWVERSTAWLAPVTPETTGYDAEQFGEYYAPGVDGYAWHVYGMRVGERVVPDYEATGNGGQLLIVVPEYELVVVFTGGNYMQGGIWGRWGTDIVGGVIIPAIRN